jgi:predicted DCC family thiol-disulfide oxidoreductase YuxK
MPETRESPKKDIKIIYDGVCNLCSGLVRFLKKNDPGNRFMYIPSQSDTGKRLINEYIKETIPEFIIVIQGGKLYTRSSAVLKIIKALGFPYNLLYVGVIFPAQVRDFIYNYIARQRYKWFGTNEEVES